MTALLIWPFFLLTACKGQTPSDPPPPPPSTIKRYNPGTINVPAPSTSTITLDTHSTRWSQQPFDTLSIDNGIAWASILENRMYGKMAKSEHYFFSAAIQSSYTDGKRSSGELIIDVLNFKGGLIATNRKINIEGYTTICIIADGVHSYLMYQEALSPTSRDLYVAKIDTNATILWTTRIGTRIGTFGNGLLKIHPDGSVIALSNNYEPVHIDVLDSSTGAILKSHRLDFSYDMDVESFLINSAGHIVAIATQIYYIEWIGYTSVMVFELDTAFTVIRQQLFTSDLEVWAEDIVQRNDGYYTFLLNAEFESQNFKEEFEINILGVLDPNFKLFDQQAIEIFSDGTDAGICIQKDHVYLYQRGAGTFNLHKLNPALQLQRSYTTMEHYLSPGFMAINDHHQIWMGGYTSGMWLVELSLAK